jgi:hypothetical protein
MNPTEKPVKKRSREPNPFLEAALVLAIILVLIGDILMGGMDSGLKAPPRAKAANDIVQICIACQNYVTKYGTLPPSSENYRLTKILCGDNPRGITFINLMPSKLNPNGEMIDPWGTPFRITFDPNFKVHVISAGPDKIFGTPDDITNQ